jgi:hypothetical protein
VTVARVTLLLSLEVCPSEGRTRDVQRAVLLLQDLLEGGAMSELSVVSHQAVDPSELVGRRSAG